MRSVDHIVSCTMALPCIGTRHVNILKIYKNNNCTVGTTLARGQVGTMIDVANIGVKHLFQRNFDGCSPVNTLGTVTSRQAGRTHNKRLRVGRLLPTDLSTTGSRKLARHSICRTASCCGAPHKRRPKNTAGVLFSRTRGALT